MNANRTIGRALAVVTAAIILTDPLRKVFERIEIIGAVIVPAIIILAGTYAAVATARSRANAYTTLGRLSLFLGASLGIYAVANALASHGGTYQVIAALNAYVLIVFIAVWLSPKPSRFSVRVAESGARPVLITGAVVCATAIGSLLTNYEIFESITADTRFHSFVLGDLHLHPGIFVTGERLARIALVVMLVGTAILFSREPISNDTRRLAAISVLSSVIALVLSGRRFAIVLAILGVALLALSSRRARWQSMFVVAGVLGAATLAVVWADDTGNLGRFLVSGFEVVDDRIPLALSVIDAGVLGHGGGSLSLGPVLEGTTGSAEGIIARVSGELGWVGLLMFAAWSFSVTALAIIALWRPAHLWDSVFGAYCLLALLWALKAQVVFRDAASLFVFGVAWGFVADRSTVRNRRETPKPAALPLSPMEALSATTTGGGQHQPGLRGVAHIGKTSAN